MPKKKKSKLKDTLLVMKQPRGNERPLPTPKAWNRNKKSSKIFKAIFDESQGMNDNVAPFKGMGYEGLSRLPLSHQATTVADRSSAFGFPLAGDGALFLGPEKDKDGNAIHASKDSGDSGLTINANGSDVTLTPPPFHTPGNAQDAFNLPKSYVEQIRWSRIMYNLNAYIGALTDLKAYYPLSKFKLTTSEPFVTEFYTQNAFNKDFSLYTHFLRMSLGFHKFGEAISWGARKQDGTWPKTGKVRWVWDYHILLEPELVEIKKSLIGSSKPQFFMRPSRDLEELVKRMDNGDPEVAQYSNKIGDKIKKKIRDRDLVPLDSSTVSAIQNLTDASAVRGTPPYQRLFNTFILEDFIRLAQMTEANRYHFPIELWTLGDLEKNIMPNSVDLDNLRTLVQSAIQTPPFSIFFAPILKYEVLSVTKNFQVKEAYEYIWRQYTVGLQVSENIVLGEALALDTPIPTPTGWTTMGELEVGDEVFARDGSVTRVIAISPTFTDRPTYMVTADTASPIVADENHKWLVGERKCKYSAKQYKERGVGAKTTFVESIFKTKELVDNIFTQKGKSHRFQIPVASPLDLPAKDLPIPPYTLGAWLGDGSTNGYGAMANHVQDHEIIENIIADGFVVKKYNSYCAWGINKLGGKLKRAGFIKNKHIPLLYLRSSFSQRLALLQGLMDTDGTCHNRRACSFVNTNLALVTAVRELILTLGFKAWAIVKKDNSGSSYGSTQPIYEVSFTVGHGQPIPFRLRRKALRCRPENLTHQIGTKSTRRAITSVERVESVPTRCIQVSHPSGTFLAGRDFVITHNSGIFSSTDTSSNQAFIRGRKKDRDQLEDWATWNFFEPLARWNNLKVKKGSILSLILPEYEWDKTLDYTAEEREMETAKFLYKEGKYPTARLLSKSRENPEQIEAELKSELNTVFDDGKRIAAPFVRKEKKDEEKNNKSDVLAPGTPITDDEAPEGGSSESVGEGGGGGPAAGGMAPSVDEEAPGAEEAPEAGPEETKEIL